MATEYKLEVQKREEYGKKASKNLRRNGVIPGIYYSHNSKESIPFLVTQKVLREALIIKYEGEIAEAKATIQVYMNNPVGIGEHPDIIAAIDTQIENMAHAEEKLLAVKNHFVPERVIWPEST